MNIPLHLTVLPSRSPSNFNLIVWVVVWVKPENKVEFNSIKIF